MTLASACPAGSVLLYACIFALLLMLTASPGLGFIHNFPSLAAPSCCSPAPAFFACSCDAVFSAGATGVAGDGGTAA